MTMNDAEIDRHSDIVQRLARIEEGVAGLYTHMPDIETRLSTLERWRTLLIGASSAIALWLNRANIHTWLGLFS